MFSQVGENSRIILSFLIRKLSHYCIIIQTALENIAIFFIYLYKHKRQLKTENCLTYSSVQKFNKSRIKQFVLVFGGLTVLHLYSRSFHSIIDLNEMIKRTAKQLCRFIIQAAMNRKRNFRSYKKKKNR